MNVRSFIKFKNGSYGIKVTGVTIGNRQQVVKSLRTNQVLELKREPTNAYDSNALAVFNGNQQVGYVPKELSVVLSPQIDRDSRYLCSVYRVIGGGIGHHYGVIVNLVPVKTNVHATQHHFDDDHDTGDFFVGMNEDERQGWDDWFEYVNDH